VKNNVESAHLADVLIERLNALIHDPEVRADIARLIENRVTCSAATLNHETIQATPFEKDKHTVKGEPPDGWVGVLGLLNGIVGILPDGPKKGWGYITAVFEDDGSLARFVRTDSRA